MLSLDSELFLLEADAAPSGILKSFESSVVPELKHHIQFHNRQR